MIPRLLCLLVVVLCWTTAWHSALHAQGSSRFDYFYLEAQKFKLRGDYASATELFGHCLEIDPTAPEALFSMGTIMHRLLFKNDSVGTAMLEEACRRDSSNSDYLKGLGTIYLEALDIEKAIPVLERLSRLPSHSSLLFDVLVMVYRSVGDYAKALETLHRQELMNGLNEDIARKRADVYLDMEMPDSARMEIQRLVDTFPREARYKLMLAALYVDDDMPNEALALLEDVQRSDPHFVNLPYEWLYFYRHTDLSRFVQMRDSLLFDPATDDELRCEILDDYQHEAYDDFTYNESLRVAYDTLLARPDCSVEVMLSKAKWLAQATASDSAYVDVLQKVLDKDAGNGQALMSLFYVYFSHGDYAGVEDVCRRGMNSCPGNLLYPHCLAGQLYADDQNEEALAVLKQGLRSRDKDTEAELISDSFGLLGSIYHAQHRDAEAFAAYDSSLVYNQNNIRSLNNYAYNLSLTGERLDEAEEMSYRTVVNHPDVLVYVDTYAWILFQEGRYTDARFYMNRLLDSSLPDDELLQAESLTACVLEHAGDIHACCGDMEQAMRFWRLALRCEDESASKQLKAKIEKRKYLK